MTDDYFRARLDQMIDLRHPLAVLAHRLPWGQIEEALAPSFVRKNRKGKQLKGEDLFGTTLAIAGCGISHAGRPRLSIRLMASLLYLKHAFNLSDEQLVERWAENVVWQYFSGMEYYAPKLPCDATQIGRFRKAIGEAGVEELLKATIDTAVETKAVKPAEFERIIVDSTVQEKAIAHPVDSRLMEIARYHVVKAAKAVGIELKQTYAKECKALRRKAGGYAHARQYRRQAIEPVIGHMKSDNRLGRCWLKGQLGDALHAVLCASGYNIRWLMRAMVRLGLKALLLRLKFVKLLLAILDKFEDVTAKSLNGVALSLLQAATIRG